MGREGGRPREIKGEPGGQRKERLRELNSQGSSPAVVPVCAELLGVAESFWLTEEARSQRKAFL